jgi:hypothetical protein
MTRTLSTVSRAVSAESIPKLNNPVRPAVMKPLRTTLFPA